MSDNHYSFEEEFHDKERKKYKKERKHLERTDRSKYKKTDSDKKRAPKDLSTEENLSLKKGRVLAITPEGIVVSNEHIFYTCVLKGALKKEVTLLKNLIAVGDFVQFFERDKNEGTIVRIEKRRSILSRAHNISRQKEQLIAVNIDQVLITASVVHPPLKLHLIDRYIIAAKKGNMEPVILVNKIDLLKEPPPGVTDETVMKENALYKKMLKAYRKLKIPIIAVSVKTGVGIKALKKAMKGRASVFSGQSGVGKTSLINVTVGSELPIGPVQKKGKGVHTTTVAHLIPIDGEGFCIDTPGIRSFGLWDLKPEEVKNYFAEISQHAKGCKYPNCSHLIEPECAVRKAVKKRQISDLRFESYCALMDSLITKHLQR